MSIFFFVFQPFFLPDFADVFQQNTGKQPLCPRMPAGNLRDYYPPRSEHIHNTLHKNQAESKNRMFQKKLPVSQICGPYDKKLLCSQTRILLNIGFKR